MNESQKIRENRTAAPGSAQNQRDDLSHFVHQNVDAGVVSAINPLNHTVAWSTAGSDYVVGYIGSPVIDQSGYVYAGIFGGNHDVTKFDPANGASLQSWFFPGKLCQTPTINQNGLLLIGVSQFVDGEVNEVAAIKIGDPSLSGPYWEITEAGGQALGNTLGSPAIVCDYTGSTYVADMLGKVIRFSSGSGDNMMAGVWPTFQCGNRRAGKSISYPMVITELLPFHTGNSYESSVSRVDLFGRAVGQSEGLFDYACGLTAQGVASALWRNIVIVNPGGCTYVWPYAVNTFATGLNGAGDICGYADGSAIVWPDGANSDTMYSTLSTPGFVSGHAKTISASGTIIGYASSGSQVHAFAWFKSGSTWGGGQDKSAPDIGNPSQEQAYAYAVTDTGRIVGKAKFTNGGPLHAFVTGQSFPPVTDPLFDMGTLGGTNSEVWDMNDLSGSVGGAQNASGKMRAFYLQVGAESLQPFDELPPLPGVTRTDYQSEAYGVNSNGEVVGYAHDQNLASRAFKYIPGEGGTIIDLNTLLPPNSPWVLINAQSINDAGLIVGYGFYSGAYTCWILYAQCQD